MNEDPIDLGARRKVKKRERQRASLTRWKPSLGVVAWAILLAAAVVGYFAFGGGNRFGKADLSGSVLHAGGIAECGYARVTCLVDGDTGWQDGVKWRMLNVDAPEMGNKAACDGERDKARESLDRLQAMMAGGYSIRASGRKDKHGRQLVDVVLADGRNAGSVLQNDFLAQPWPNDENIWCSPVLLDGDQQGAFLRPVIRSMHSSEDARNGAD